MAGITIGGRIFTERYSWTRTLSALVALLGIWQIASPYVLGFNDQEPITRNAIISGVLLAIFGVLTFFGVGRWERKIVNAFAGLASVTGLWVLISPFVLNYQESTPIFWSTIVVGLLSFLLAGFAAAKQPYHSEAHV